MGGGGPGLALAADAPSATAMVVARPATTSTRLDMTTPDRNEGRRCGTPVADPSPCTAAAVCLIRPVCPSSHTPGGGREGTGTRGEGSGSRTWTTVPAARTRPRNADTGAPPT